MSRLSRFERCGAIFTDRCDSLNDWKLRGGTVAGNPIVANTAGFNAVKFDGTGDYLNHTAVSPVSGNFTMSFWFNTSITGTTANYRMFEFAQAAASGVNLTIRGDDATYRVSLDNSGGPTTTVNSVASGLNDGRWHNAVVTRTTTTYQIFVDGVAGGTSGGTAPTYNRLFVSVNSGLTSFFIGSIRDAVIFERALSAAEILSIYNNTVFSYMDNLVAEYDMSEINPQDVSYKGNGYNGTGTSLTSASITSGNYSKSKAITFDGADSKVDIATDFLGTGALTIFAWANPTSSGEGGVGRIITNGRVIIRYGGSNAIVFSSDGATNAVSAGSAFPFGAWTCVAASRTTAGTANLYINGASSGSADQASGTPAAGTSTLCIGNVTTQTATFSGSIAYVAIFSSVLNQLQIRDLYEATK